MITKRTSAVVGIAMIFVVAAAAFAFAGIGPVIQVTVPVQYYAEVWVTQTRDGQVIMQDHNHNVITSLGLDFAEQQISGTANASKILYISLGNHNNTNANATWTTMYNEFTTGGLDRNTGNLIDEPTVGNWSTSYIFTATTSRTNVTFAGLHWTSTDDADGDIFAVANFTSINMATNDQLNVTWCITVSG